MTRTLSELIAHLQQLQQDIGDPLVKINDAEWGIGDLDLRAAKVIEHYGSQTEVTASDYEMARRLVEEYDDMPESERIASAAGYWDEFGSGIQENMTREEYVENYLKSLRAGYEHHKSLVSHYESSPLTLVIGLQ